MELMDTTMEKVCSEANESELANEFDDGGEHSEDELPITKIRRNYQCPICLLFTQNPRVYLYHLRDDHEQKLKIYECNLCVYASKHAQKLQRHSRIVHHLAFEYEKTSGFPRDLDSEENVSSAGPAERSTTGGVTSEFPENRLISNPTSSQLKSLSEVTCVNSPEVLEDSEQEGGSHLKKKFYRCTRCHYVTHVKARYTKHVKYHSMPTIKCDWCDFNTPYKWNLDRHLKNHTGGGMFQCSQCNFTAHIKQSLTVHVQNHHSDGTKPVRRRQRFFEESEFDDSYSDSSKSGSPCEPLIPTTVEAIQAPEDPPKKKVRPIPNLIPINQILPSQVDSGRENPQEVAAQVMSFLGQLAERLVHVKPENEPSKSSEIRPLSLTSSRCQFCRHRCKSRNDLVAHLKICSAAIASVKEINADEGNLDAHDCEDDDAVVGLETEPGHGMVCNSKIEGPTVIRKVYKCPSCSFWATTASRFHVHMVGHTNTKPFECSECRYRSNWRWDITKHIRLKAVRDPAHGSASLILIDSSGERNYDQYEKYLTTMRVAAGAKDSTTVPVISGKKRKHDETPSPPPVDSSERRFSPKQKGVHISVPSPLSLIRGESASSLPAVEQAGSVLDRPREFEALTPRDCDQTPCQPPKPITSKEEKKTHKTNSDQFTGASTGLPPGILMDARRTVWKCKRCPFKNNSRDEVLQHIRNEHYGGQPLAANLVGRDLTWALTPKQPITGKNIPAFRCGVCNQVSNWKHVIQRHCRLKHNGNIQVIENKVPEEESPEMSHEIIPKTKQEKTKNPPSSVEYGTSLAETYAHMVGIPSRRREGKETKGPNASSSDIDKEEKGFLVRPERGQFVCTFCPYISKLVHEMEEHQMHHRQEDYQLKCLICHYYTNSKEDLNHHHILHGIKPNGELTISLATPASEQQSHLRTSALPLASPPERYCCSHCPYVGDNKFQFALHKQLHQPRGASFKCPICSFNVDKRYLLQEHLELHGLGADGASESDDESSDAIDADIDPALLPILPDSYTVALPEPPLVCVSKGGRFYKMFKCRHCPFVNATLANVEEHEKRHFLSDLEGVHCNFCNFCCTNSVALAAHKELHSYALGLIHCFADPQVPVNAQLADLISSGQHRLAESFGTLYSAKGLESYILNSSTDRSTFSLEILQQLLSHQVTEEKICGENAASQQEMQKILNNSEPEFPRHLLDQPTNSERCNTPSTFGSDDGTKNPWVQGNPWYIYPTCKKNGKTRERRYKCPKCPSAFEKREQYRIHIQLHGSQQRYKCTECDYSVKYYANFLQHVKKHEVHKELLLEQRRSVEEPKVLTPDGLETESVFQCDVCNFKVQYRYLFDEHLKVHLEDEKSGDTDSDTPLVIDTEKGGAYIESDSE